MLRRALLVAVVTVAAGCLTACGVRETLDPVAAAAAKSQQAGGFKTTMSLTFTAEGKRLTMTGSGAFGNHQGELEMDLSDLLRQTGALSGSDATIKALYLTEGGDPVMYLKLGFLAALMPGGKTWIRLDLAQAGKAAGIDLTKLLGGAGQNPTDVLAVLRAGVEFSEVGKETIDGTETNHYRGTVDLRKASAASGLTAEATKRLLDLGAPSEYPVDVWVDDSGYVRQFQTSYDETVGGSSASMTMTVGMSDYGSDVQVSAPPADQVFDATSLAAEGVSSPPAVRPTETP